MKIQTKRYLLRAAATAAVVCAAAVVFLPAAASAAPAAATANVNVRNGPSTDYPVVATLRTGEAVEVEGCRNGWCYVTRSGPSGYVSSSYLRLRTGNAAVQPNFNLSFNFPNGSFAIGNGGVAIGVGPLPTPSRPSVPSRPGWKPTPSTPSVPSRPGPSRGGDVCFFDRPDFTGSRMCMDRGDMTPYVGAAWNNRIASIYNPDGLRVTVCDDAGYDDCRTYTTSAARLGSFDRVISSIRVQ